MVVLDTLGRSYTIDPAEIPGGRGDGVPLASLIELQPGASVLSMLAGQAQDHYLLANSGGYGFIAKLGDLIGRVKTGKEIVKLEAGEHVLPPLPVWQSALINPECRLVLASAEKHLLAFPVGELKVMAKGRGLQLMSLKQGDCLTLAALVNTPDFWVSSRGKRGGIHRERLRVQDISGKRGRKGKVLDVSGSLTSLTHTQEPQ